MIAVLREFGRLGERRWSREGINAVGVVAAVLVMVLYFALSTVTKLVVIARGDSPVVMVFQEVLIGVVVICVMTLLCVTSCAKR